MPKKLQIQTPPAAPAAVADTAQRPGEQYEFREIPLELLDEPTLAIRETMDEEALAEGALDIMRIGLTNPLTVFPKGARYEVIAGHRRLLQCRIANYSPVPCRVKLGRDIDPLAILVSENAEREPVNPVHQGRFYQRILENQAENDVDKLCAIVLRKRAHVEDRLLLIRAHPRIVDAVEHKKITMAVAAELNRIPDADRMLLLLDVAVQSGATARQVADWARQGAQLGNVQVLPEGAAAAEPDPAPAPEDNPMTCVFCEESEYPHMMEMLWVHRSCKTILQRMLGRSPERKA